MSFVYIHIYLYINKLVKNVKHFHGMERVCNFVIVVRDIIEYFFMIILKLNLPVQNMSNYKRKKRRLFGV